MPKILLSKGYFTEVDDEDYQGLMLFKWSYRKSYASRADYSSDKTNWNYMMHNHIMKPPVGFRVDHADGDTLNNKRSNLRLCTISENNINQKNRKNKLTKYKGVSKHGSGYRAIINKDYKRHRIGTFKTQEEAAAQYDKYAKLYFGEFARLNNVGI